jgi:AraC-like DNA-binding protein
MNRGSWTLARITSLPISLLGPARVDPAADSAQTDQRQLRIERAKRDLRRGQSPVKVALTCGFYDQAHLTRHFHRMTGLTQLAYARG